VSALSDYLEQIARERDAIGPRAFSRLAGIPYATASRLLEGSRSPTEETLKKLADNLGLSYNKLRRLNGMRPATEPFVLPRQADRLNMRQRRLVTNLVLELANENSDEVEPDYPSDGAANPQADVLKFGSKRQRVTEAAWKPESDE
jgi:transcriptional regulator with XRE-family HTH domain